MTANPNWRCRLALALIAAVVVCAVAGALLPPGMPEGAVVLGDKGGKVIGRK